MDPDGRGVDQSDAVDEDHDDDETEVEDDGIDCDPDPLAPEENSPQRDVYIVRAHQIQ